MVASKAFAKSLCAGCRLNVLKSFVSLAGPSLQAPCTKARRSLPVRQIRQSSQKTHNISDTRAQSSSNEDADFRKGEHQEEINKSAEEAPQAQVSAIPWYLQVEAPKPSVPILSERQKLPELPELPPPILQPLLEQVSIDLGLDDLFLLDLRELDPPPALGANLIMLIGTARSEKHLHVSADRLCRWLRSHYKLRPSADGLLGRNELKVKLRRKAKRTKLMGGFEDDVDDGIRTGWVCVDVGIVQEADGVAGSVLSKDFVGFGRRTEGVRLVVQMLTEEKRLEIELEKLWGGILKRGGQPETVEALEDLSVGDPSTIEVPAQPESETQIIDAQALFPSQQPTGRDLASHSPLRFHRGFSEISELGQRRRLHNATLSRQTQDLPPSYMDSKPPAIGITNTEGRNAEKIEESILALFHSGQYDTARDVASEHSRKITTFQDGQWRLFLLDLMKMYLQYVPGHQAKELLGTHDGDTSSTPFLKLFYELLPQSHSSITAELRIWLLCYGRDIRHPGYNNEKLLELFREILASGVQLSSVSYKQLLRSVLLTSRDDDAFHEPALDVLETTSWIIHTMHDQGLKVISEEMLVNLQEVTTPTSAPKTMISGSIIRDETDTFDLPSLPMPPIQKRLHLLMKSVDLPLFAEESRLRLMELYARNDYWLEFWDIFRMAPQHDRPQSATMYAFMFDTVASFNNQRATMTVLRNWYPNMLREIPPVHPTGDLGLALRRCLVVADPSVEEAAAGDAASSDNEWVKMWRQIQ